VRQVTIALVQPGMISNASLRVDASDQLTASLSRSGRVGSDRPDLIVWGESSVANVDLRKNPQLLGRIRTLSAENGVEILASQDTELPGLGKQKIADLIGPQGIGGSYLKSRLVPFGEYIPFRQQLGWLTKISKAASSNMVPGTGAHDLQASDREGRPLSIGVLICFESAFPDMSRVDTDHGAQLIVYQSATSTFQGTWGPDQHASYAALRAAETGRPVVQAALTGDSVAFDARGRLLAWMGQSQHGVVTVRLGLPAADVRTPYDRFGDYVPWASLAIVAVSAVIMLVRRRGQLRGIGGVAGGPEAQYDEDPGRRVPG
jgi:apolipoprotein N-acyltransferase